MGLIIYGACQSTNPACPTQSAHPHRQERRSAQEPASWQGPGCVGGLCFHSLLTWDTEGNQVPSEGLTAKANEVPMSSHPHLHHVTWKAGGANRGSPSTSALYRRRAGVPQTPKPDAHCWLAHLHVRAEPSVPGQRLQSDT